MVMDDESMPEKEPNIYINGFLPTYPTETNQSEHDELIIQIQCGISDALGTYQVTPIALDARVILMVEAA